MHHRRWLDVPVNADFEDGFAVEPEKVAADVSKAVKTGVAGLSIEDYAGDKDKPLFDASLSVERIKAARKAIDADLVACCSRAVARLSCAASTISIRLSNDCRRMQQQARIVSMHQASRRMNRSRPW